MPRFTKTRSRHQVLLLSLVAASTLLGQVTPLQAQDLVGCQLVDGQLSCVPGVSADPQSQIQALRQQISTDLQQESAVQQQIDGLQQLELQGEAVQGQLLQATAVADALAALPPQAFHWYRRTPGASQWLLIAGASGPTYVLQPEDVSAQVMVVVAVTVPGGGANRQASTVAGPVRSSP
jgi:hypothetical protein